MSKVSDQSSKRLELSTHAEAREMLWSVVPPQAHDNRKSWLARAARAMGWGERRTKAIFYCEARVLKADEWRSLQARYDALKNSAKQRGEHGNELREIAGAPWRSSIATSRGVRPMVDGASPEGTEEPRTQRPT
jgi:hypothetical protein